MVGVHAGRCEGLASESPLPPPEITGARSSVLDLVPPPRGQGASVVLSLQVGHSPAPMEVWRGRVRVLGKDGKEGSAAGPGTLSVTTTFPASTALYQALGGC